MEYKSKINAKLCVDENTAKIFCCPFCNSIPFENEVTCLKCGKLYCEDCIKIKNFKCIECKSISKENFQNVQRTVVQQIRRLEIKCEKCNNNFILENYVCHLKFCGNPKCEYSNCNEYLMNDKIFNYKEPNSSIRKFCSLECLYAYKITSLKRTNQEYYQKEVKNVIIQLLNEAVVHKNCQEDKKNPEVGPTSSHFLEEMSDLHLENSFLISDNGICEFAWDSSNSPNCLEFSNGIKSVFLQEKDYYFRTIISNKFFKSGIFYWEIEADERTENELKIGVTTKKDFNLISSFADYEFGYAFFGVGQLRHGSNSIGKKYGKSFKNHKGDFLGICLDMNKGTLSFALNDEFLGIAFSDEALKLDPIYPAISLLHKAGAKLVTGKPLPACFKN